MKLTRNEIVDRLNEIKYSMLRDKNKAIKGFTEYENGYLHGINIAFDLLSRTKIPTSQSPHGTNARSRTSWRRNLQK